MTDLGDLMGALVSAFVQARRIADEETAAVAEYYKDHPLLEGLTLPRVRVPEMTLELPVVIEAIEEGEPAEANEPEKIKEEIKKEVTESLKREDLKVSPNFHKYFDLELSRNLPDPKKFGNIKSQVTKESAIRGMELALKKTLAKKGVKDTLTAAQTQTVLKDLRQKVGEVALKKEGLPTRVRATIVTSEVKEKAGAANVTRVRLSLKEEGLEWTTIEHEDGTSSRKLTPE